MPPRPKSSSSSPRRGRTQGELRRTGTFENFESEIFQRKGTTGTGQRGTKVKVGKAYRSDTQATCFTQLICAYSNRLGLKFFLKRFLMTLD